MCQLQEEAGQLLEVQEVQEEAGQLWEVQEVAGRGLGVVARVALAPGTLVMEDRPLVTVPAHIHQPYYTLSPTQEAAGSDLQSHLAASVAALGEEDRRSFWSLEDCKAGGGAKTECGVYFTNCYMLGESRAASTGILPLISRVNHSCRPNTEFSWSQSRGLEELRVSRAISPGEELTDCYLDLTVQGRDTRAGRRELLQAAYGFWCQCEVCGLQGEEGEQEEQLRGEHSRLNRPGAGQELGPMLARAERLLELRTLLHFKLAHRLEAMESVFGLSVVCGQDWRARQVARLGVATATIRLGAGHPTVEEWASRERDPTGYMLS